MQNKRYFITYGDSGYEQAKARICNQAAAIGEFDHIIAYGREDLSLEIQQSQLFHIKRGGGLWCWKPDVILTTLGRMSDGDCLIYCDAGCTLQRAKEWSRLWKRLQNYDIIASRIFQRTDRWTRRELLDYMRPTNPQNWERYFQHMATTIIIKKSSFTVRFFQEWKTLLLRHPEFVMDVSEVERASQHPTFVENRHDQSVYSALVYKYLNHQMTRDRIFSMWEHIEDFDIFHGQAIRATRLRKGEKKLPLKQEVKAAIKRMIKDYVYKPLWIIPHQWYYERKTNH